MTQPVLLRSARGQPTGLVSWTDHRWRMALSRPEPVEERFDPPRRSRLPVAAGLAVLAVAAVLRLAIGSTVVAAPVEEPDLGVALEAHNAALAAPEPAVAEAETADVPLPPPRPLWLSYPRLGKLW